MLVIKQNVLTTLVVGGSSVRIVAIRQDPAQLARVRVYVAGVAIGELTSGSVVFVGPARLKIELIASTGSVRWAIDAPRDVEVYRQKFKGAA